MPFTPLHMGPALLCKPLAKWHLSLIVFGIAQVATDLGPLAHMITGKGRYHGTTHTYLGALVVALLVIAFTRPLCLFILRTWNAFLSKLRLAWLREDEDISWKTMIISAFAGTLSHVFIDSFVHADMFPLEPFSEGKHLLGLLSGPWLDTLCATLFIAGAVVWIIARWRARDLGK